MNSAYLIFLIFKGVLHLLPKSSMFVLYLSLSLDNQQWHRWKITNAYYSKLFKELKNGIEILVGQAVFKL